MTLLTLSELAEICDARLEGDGASTVSGPAGLSDARSDEVSFLTEAKYLDQLETTRAAAVVVAEGVETQRKDLALLRVANPRQSFNRVVLAFAPVTHLPPPGVHPSAVVDSTARVAEGAIIGPLCLVGVGAEIADGAILHGHVTVGEKVSIGEGTEIHPGVVLYRHVRIGQHCVVMEHAVIRGAGQHPCLLGNHVLVGPQAHISGATVHGRAFIATGASVFNGAILEEGVVVAINAVVHIGTRCLAGTGVPIGHIAFGAPATVYAPHDAPAVHAQLSALGFTKVVFGLETSHLADADAIEQLCARYALALGAHRDDQVVPE